ncbi:hypothetical protein BGZ65_006259 [Modicella reniformis]|uniref:Uncharacterized protein n=1 Tax=Modicella reniformis TaxID=1440133 RepID=A0A9P6MB40_9FUNG|nr:hypothetical protein BGZ65_006259 [Modicella reniformis]
MVMENTAMGGTSRLVTVTKPMLGDQFMDFAGNHDSPESNIDLDSEAEDSDDQSLLSSDDNFLAQATRMLSVKDKGISILKISNSQMLSSTHVSGMIAIPGLKENGEVQVDSDSSCSNTESCYDPASNRAAADRAWKVRIRQTISSEADLPEEIRTVARSIFKILREFDVVTVDENDYDDDDDDDDDDGDNDEVHWAHAGGRLPTHVGNSNIRSLLIHGIEQARLFGSHASAISFHHSLRVLESSPVLQQLDSSKIIYLLAMPIKHRLDHRAGRARSRTIWEGFAHSWHLRLVSAIERKRELLSSLRIKMYYQMCVRTSRAFEKSLGVVVALSRLNRAALRKYLTAEEWERCYGMIPGWSETDNGGAKGSYLDHSSHNFYGGDGAGHQTESSSRRYSANSNHSHALRTAKGRRSSFSAYGDNMGSRSVGSSSLLDTSLGHLKEKEQATFSNSYGSGNQNMFWSGNSNGQSGSMGSLSDLTDVQSDFNMNARESEAVRHWITDAAIHNFLPGEENFLRFCMEVESVVRGIGLGGTGIQGAGIPQVQNGVMLPVLSNSGSDFFIKEVAKYNGQFVTGMGPAEQAAPSKSTPASGVTEFLVNSLKSGNAATSLPTATGSHFFSQASSSVSSFHNAFSGLSGGGGSNNSQSSQPSTASILGGGSIGRTRITSRQLLPNSHQTHDPIPTLPDDPSSIYSFPPGPTYALYNPPYSTTSHGVSSSYSGLLAPGGVSATISPHQTSQLPKDMTEFLRRIQLKLTSFVLSEWLDLFGEVEADRWFIEFLDEMGSQDCKDDLDEKSDPLAAVDTNQDGYIPLNEMDVRDKPHNEPEPYPAPGFTGPGEGIRSCLDNVGDSGSLGSVGSQWVHHNCHSSMWSEHQQLSQEQCQQSGFDPEEREYLDGVTAMKPSASASSFTTTGSMTTAPSVGSIFDTVAHQPMVDASGNLKNSGENYLNIQTKNITGKRSARAKQSKPYDFAEAYRSTIEQFNDATSPYQKLGHLYALELLIVASISYPDSCDNSLIGCFSGLDMKQQGHGGSRLSSTRSKASAHAAPFQDAPPSPRTFTPGTDAIVNEIEILFRRPGVLRPRHLLRDMQLIATFIPGSILDLRDDGKAFWDIALAISSLKNNVVEYIVQKGTQYVEVEESSRTSQEIDRNGGMSRMQEDDERIRMAEAVRLFTIGAKELNAVAQRELAILYMSLPMLPSSSPPPMGHRGDGSPQIAHISRMPSPISITTSKFGKGPRRTNTPPLSPKGTFSNPFLSSKSSTASIPIKQRSRHQRSSSGSGSSFGSGVLSGLGIMTGLGSLTGTSSMGSGGSSEAAPNNSSTASLQQLQLQYQNQQQQQQQHPGEFAEGYRDEEQQHSDIHPGRLSVGHYTGSANLSQHQQYHNHQNHHHGHQSNSNVESGPDKFNPENVATAMHWFTLAAAQGDKFSINYLKHKDTAGGMLGSMG